LNALIAIEGNLAIVENDSLTSLTGLDDIGSIGGTLRIYMKNNLPTPLIFQFFSQECTLLNWSQMN